MWCSCKLPDTSDLHTRLGWGRKAGLPLKPQHWFWSLKAGSISGPGSSRRQLSWEPGDACYIWEVSGEAEKLGAQKLQK